MPFIPPTGKPHSLLIDDLEPWTKHPVIHGEDELREGDLAVFVRSDKRYAPNHRFPSYYMTKKDGLIRSKDGQRAVFDGPEGPTICYRIDLTKIAFVH